MHPHGRLRVRRVTRPVPFVILAAMPASASVGEEDKVPDIFACADPWQWWLAPWHPGTSTRVPLSPLCCTMGGPGGLRVRPVDAVRAGSDRECLSGPGETPALGLHAHMAYASVRTRRTGFGDLGDFRFPWEGS